MQFATLRLITIVLAVLSQAYLFVRVRQAILSSHRSTTFKSRVIRIAGAMIFLLFTSNVYIMSRPIPWENPPVSAQLILFYPPALWGFGSVFSALLLFLTGIIARLGGMIVQFSRILSGRKVSLPLDPGRRRFLQAGVCGIAAAPLIVSGYGASYADRAYDLRTLTLPFGQPLRVAQISDIHAGIYMNRKEMRRYADQIVALQPDLFVITGDFISNSMSFLPGCLEELARVRAHYGTFATLGNHEHWYGDLSVLLTTFRHYRIPLLQNAHQVIQTDRGEFAVAGIDDLIAGNPDLTGALRGLGPTIPTLLLSHRPEIFPQAAAWGIPLTLAGHYHGGQIKLNLPGGAVSLAHLRTLYPEGLYRINKSHLYVNRGIGTTFTPIRLNAPPEVTLFNLI